MKRIKKGKELTRKRKRKSGVVKEEMIVRWGLRRVYCIDFCTLLI